MVLAVLADRNPLVAGMAAGSSEVSHIDWVVGCRIHSLTEGPHHYMEQNSPEVVASTVGSLAVHIVPVRMVTAGHMDLVGREDTAKRCEDRHQPGAKGPGHHAAEEPAFFRSFSFKYLKIVVFRCEYEEL